MKLDPELKAMQSVLAICEDLETSSAQRVLDWVKYRLIANCSSGIRLDHSTWSESED